MISSIVYREINLNNSTLFSLFVVDIFFLLDYLLCVDWVKLHQFTTHARTKQNEIIIFCNQERIFVARFERDYNDFQSLTLLAWKQQNEDKILQTTVEVIFTTERIEQSMCCLFGSRVWLWELTDLWAVHLQIYICPIVDIWLTHNKYQLYSYLSKCLCCHLLKLSHIVDLRIQESATNL